MAGYASTRSPGSPDRLATFHLKSRSSDPTPDHARQSMRPSSTRRAFDPCPMPLLAARRDGRVIAVELRLGWFRQSLNPLRSCSWESSTPVAPEWVLVGLSQRGDFDVNGLIAFHSLPDIDQFVRGYRCDQATACLIRVIEMVTIGDPLVYRCAQVTR